MTEETKPGAVQRGGMDEGDDGSRTRHVRELSLAGQGVGSPESDPLGTPEGDAISRAISGLEMMLSQYAEPNSVTGWPQALRAAIDILASLPPQPADLRGEVERLTASSLVIARCAAHLSARAEKAEAELAEVWNEAENTGDLEAIKDIARADLVGKSHNLAQPSDLIPVSAADAARANRIDPQAVAEAMEGDAGFWATCSGCHESDDGYPTGPYSTALQCTVGVGCRECGGIGAVWDTTDYAAMAAEIVSLTAQPVAQEARTDGPDRIWAWAGDEQDGWENAYATVSHVSKEQVEYIRADLAHPATPHREGDNG